MTFIHTTIDNDLSTIVHAFFTLSIKHFPSHLNRVNSFSVWEKSSPFCYDNENYQICSFHLFLRYEKRQRYVISIPAQEKQKYIK